MSVWYIFLSHSHIHLCSCKSSSSPTDPALCTYPMAMSLNGEPQKWWTIFCPPKFDVHHFGSISIHTHCLNLHVPTWTVKGPIASSFDSEKMDLFSATLGFPSENKQATLELPPATAGCGSNIHCSSAAFDFHSEPRDPNLSRTPPETQKRIRCLQRTIVGKNGKGLSP